MLAPDMWKKFRKVFDRDVLGLYRRGSLAAKRSFRTFSICAVCDDNRWEWAVMHGSMQG